MTLKPITDCAIDSGDVYNCAEMNMVHMNVCVCCVCQTLVISAGTQSYSLHLLL